MSHSTWIHRVVRLGVKPLASTPITPNHLTTLRLVTGVLAAMVLATGHATWVAYGALLFVVSTLLDRADGELARLSGKTSAWGHSYDLMADAACNASIFVGIGIGLRSSSLGSLAVVLGLVAGMAVMMVLWLIVRIESLQGERSAEFKGAAGFDPDDAILVVPVAMVMGWGQPLLIAAAVGTPVFALCAYWYFRHKLNVAKAYRQYAG